MKWADFMDTVRNLRVQSMKWVILWIGNVNLNQESFNAKIRSFRAQLSGLSDVKHFLFRLTNIYA